MPLTAATDAAPLSAEIVNGRTNAAPIDGKVEMLLSVLARDTAGKAVNVVKVTGWTVDGRAQLDAQGQPIALNALPVQLPEGKHSVSVTGLAADGRSVAGSADVSVDIAVREESTVRLKQLTPPPTPPAPKTSKP